MKLPAVVKKLRSVERDLASILDEISMYGVSSVNLQHLRQVADDICYLVPFLAALTSTSAPTTGETK